MRGASAITDRSVWGESGTFSTGKRGRNLKTYFMTTLLATWLSLKDHPPSATMASEAKGSQDGGNEMVTRQYFITALIILAFGFT